MEYLIASRCYPIEITTFLHDVFELYEIRARVGAVNGIVFQIRTNERNHTVTHVHAEYGKYSVSIEIETGKILAGNLPKKNQKMAVKWVLEHKDKLLNDWGNIAITAETSMTRSRLDFRE